MGKKLEKFGGEKMKEGFDKIRWNRKGKESWKGWGGEGREEKWKWNEMEMERKGKQRIGKEGKERKGKER